MWGRGKVVSLLVFFKMGEIRTYLNVEKRNKQGVGMGKPDIKGPGDEARPHWPPRKGGSSDSEPSRKTQP